MPAGKPSESLTREEIAGKSATWINEHWDAIKAGWAEDKIVLDASQATVTSLEDFRGKDAAFINEHWGDLVGADR